MSKDVFNFKHFTIKQDLCAMKVGTDGVLLGAWANIPESGKIADVGTGTGLIAIMAAQRSSGAIITGVEIDEDAGKQALCNMKSSPWSDRLRVEITDVNNFYQNHLSEFDCILSNPPYFTENVKSNKEKRTLARHVDSLSFSRLSVAVSSMLKEGGNFCVILPYDAAMNFITEAVVVGFKLRRRTDVITKKGSTPKRVMMEFVKNGCMDFSVHDSLLLSENGQRTEEYKMLTKDFYL